MSAAELAIAPRWSAALAAVGLVDYASFMTLEIGERLEKPNLGSRVRMRLELTDPDGHPQAIFLKRYGQAGPETVERDAIAAVRDCGIETMETLAWGRGELGGFIAVSRVAGVSMFDGFEDLLAARGRNDPLLNATLAAELGAMAARLHGAGLAHRDFYTTHIFLAVEGEAVRLSLIDLARVFRPQRCRWRWWIKDLAQLKFSLPRPWVRRNWPKVVDGYLAGRGLDALPPLTDLRISLKAAAMARSYRRRLERMNRGTPR